MNIIDPATISGAIIWGVVSGFFTSFLLFLIGLFVTKIALPNYLDFIYKGVDLRGVWIEERAIANNGTFSIQLNISQKANKITGTGILRKAGGNGPTDYTQFFTLQGSTWEGFLTLTMQSTNRTSLSFVAGLLKVKGRGRTLEGHWVFRAASVDEAVSEKLLLTRQADV